MENNKKLSEMNREERLDFFHYTEEGQQMIADIKKIMMKKENDEIIKIIEGHNSSSYFWIMPVKIKDMNKNTDAMDNVEECSELEISIEEEDIRSYLFPLLLEAFDDELEVNKKRNVDMIEYIRPQVTSSFEWYLTYNFFTIENIENLINRIKYISELLETDYNNPELDEIKIDYDWLIYALPEYDRKKEYSKEEIDKLIENNKHYIINFYSRFIKYMENMIKQGKEKGYTLISFMGP